MLISELIKELEKKKEEVGDVEVAHWDDWSAFSIEEVNLYEEKYILLGRDIHGFGKRME